MNRQRSIFTSASLLTLCLALITGCAPQATAEPTATFVPSPTQLPTPEPPPTPVLKPIEQGYINMAYDSESERIILMNGQGNKYIVLEPEVWAFDTVTNIWGKRAGIITGEGPMVYDSQSDRIIVFLGTTGGHPSQLLTLRKTLAYDYNTDTWTDMNPAESPIGYIGARMVYDSESDKAILVGGSHTWVYDFETNTWTDMLPTGDFPPGENYQAMSYDAAADRVVLWQCVTGQPICRIGIYDYNSNTWETRETDTEPLARYYCNMVYDPQTGLNILFGGHSLADDNLAETWGYDYASNTWKLLSPANPPSPRGRFAMAYDPKAGKVVIFGGGIHQFAFTNETWVYDPATNEWNNITVYP